jgi:hypothetical protein
VTTPGESAKSAERREDWAAAKEAGCVFYSLPGELNYDQVDPLIADVCRSINASGWVATAESCQGHPDAEHAHPWAGNTSPMLRLVCRAERAGAMLLALADGLRS